jgi:hypothetical protein
MMMSPMLMPDPEDDALILRHIGISSRHAVLDDHRAGDRIHHTGKLDENTVPGGFHDRPMVSRDYAASRTERQIATSALVKKIGPRATRRTRFATSCVSIKMRRVGRSLTLIAAAQI